MSRILIAESSRDELWRVWAGCWVASWIPTLGTLGVAFVMNENNGDTFAVLLVTQLVAGAVAAGMWTWWRCSPAFRTAYFLDGTELVAQAGGRTRRKLDLASAKDVWVTGDLTWGKCFFWGVGTPFSPIFPRAQVQQETQVLARALSPIFLWGEPARRELDLRISMLHRELRNDAALPPKVAPWVYPVDRTRSDVFMRFAYFLAMAQWSGAILAALVWPV